MGWVFREDSILVSKHLRNDCAYLEIVQQLQKQGAAEKCCMCRRKMQQEFRICEGSKHVAHAWLRLKVGTHALSEHSGSKRNNSRQSRQKDNTRGP